MDAAREPRCLEPGLSILIGTVDPNGWPACCRGIAIRSDDDLKTLTVYVPVATSQQVIQNIATTKRLAVGASYPPSHLTTQLKGTTIDTRLARDDEAPFVHERLNAFAEVLDGLGIPRRLTRSLTHWPAFAITMRVEQVFEQTPGPHAGTRIR